ncbi:MAG: ATP-binding protein [Clostridia bacterium]|nr:ATP-binding protein [Clostridia bacterium]
MKNKSLKSIFLTLVILAVFFFICYVVSTVLDENMLITLISTLAVFLISVVTSGYIFGMISSGISVLYIYWLKSFPINPTDTLISFLITITISVLTSYMKERLKVQASIWEEREKERMRANLLRAVSHDLRTPLTAIYGAGSALLENDDILPKEKKTEILKGIKEDSEWLIQMMENLLSVTKIENSNLEITKSAVVLEELIDSALRKFKKRHPDTNVEISIPGDFVMVSCDPVLIEQVLLNLMQNAVEHAKGMTKILLKISVTEDNVLFEIIDDGAGIKTEKLKNLFSAHFPSDTEEKHMGVGLSVCSSIIKAHGSNIKAENIKSGGMKFFFSLGLEEDI